MSIAFWKTLRFKSSTKQDEGWAWVVLVAATLNSFSSLGAALGCGVYVSEVIQRWNASKATGAFVGSLMFAMFSSSGPPTTFLVSRTSHRTAIVLGGLLSAAGLVAAANVPNIIGFYFTFSIMCGIGSGMVFLQSVMLVNLYFSRYRGIASGITIAGGGGGVLLMPLLERMLIEHFSWQPSLYIVAGMCLNSCVLGALMRPIKLNTTDTELDFKPPSAGSKDLSIIEEKTIQNHTENGLLRNRTYICYAVNNTLYGFGCSIPIILGPDLYMETGFAGVQIDILIACFGVGNILGRLVGGVLCNIPAVNRLCLYVILNILLGVFIGLYTVSDDFTLYAFSSVGYGLIFGAFIVTQAVVTMDIVGLRQMEKAFSFAYFTCSIGIIAGAPISGTLFDLTKSYKWPYLAAAVVVISSSAILVPSLLAGNRRCSKERQSHQAKGTVIQIDVLPEKVPLKRLDRSMNCAQNNEQVT